MNDGWWKLSLFTYIFAERKIASRYEITTRMQFKCIYLHKLYTYISCFRDNIYFGVEMLLMLEIHVDRVYKRSLCMRGCKYKSFCHNVQRIDFIWKCNAVRTRREFSSFTCQTRVNIKKFGIPLSPQKDGLCIIP